MSTRFHDQMLGNHYSNGSRSIRQALLRAQTVKNSLYANIIKDHHFKIFRLGMDICARCQKPRSEHPRAPR